jgi:hypothetical protein
MSNQLDNCLDSTLAEQAYTEAEYIFVEYLKQSPVSRKAVERIERNIVKLALAANRAALKPVENDFQADDGAAWHRGVELMDNIFLCHREIVGGTKYAVVEYFPTHDTHEIWNEGRDATQVLRVFVNEQRRALEFAMRDVAARVKDFLAEKYSGQEMSRMTESFLRRFSQAGSPRCAHTYAYVSETPRGNGFSHSLAS